MKKIRAPIKHKAIRSQIFAYLDAHGPTTCGELSDRLWIPNKSISSALSKCIEEGILMRQVKCRGAKYERVQAPVEKRAKEEWHGIPAGRPYRLQIALERAGVARDG